MTAEEMQELIDKACIKFSFVKSEGTTGDIRLDDYNNAGLMILAYTAIRLLEDETGMDYKECLRMLKTLCKKFSSNIRKYQNE